MTTSPSFKTWIAAARLRTLPLALATIILGSLLAAFYGRFNGAILLLSILTAFCYQILSNFANDLGDGLKGTDNNRQGEKRAIASGLISISQMKRAVILLSVLSFVFGTWLSIWATAMLPTWVTLLFIGLGITAIAAALSYTMGRKAYGYSGFGDLFVVIFFGWIGVIGSFFLQAKQFNPLVVLPATSVGLLATGVLNLNNMRDLETDRQAHKNTLVVRIGRPAAKVYHFFLLLTAMVLQLIWVQQTKPGWGGYLFLLVLPLLVMNMISVVRADKPAAFDPLLRPLAITTFLFCLLAGLGQNINHILVALNL
jgi:1,4-dihydroxy-2-naphthoate octaprenyltransferase